MYTLDPLLYSLRSMYPCNIVITYYTISYQLSTPCTLWPFYCTVSAVCTRAVVCWALSVSCNCIKSVLKISHESRPSPKPYMLYSLHRQQFYKNVSSFDIFILPNLFIYQILHYHYVHSSEQLVPFNWGLHMYSIWRCTSFLLNCSYFLDVLIFEHSALLLYLLLIDEDMLPVT